MDQPRVMKLIDADSKWHSWKCRCGCLNRRDVGNCGRCHGMRGPDSLHYGNDGYIFQPQIK